MARKEAIFTAKVDTGSSVNDVKKLEKEMVDLNDQMEELSKNGEQNTTAFKDLSKAFDKTQNDLKKFSGDMEHLGGDILVEVTGSISKMEDRMYELALAGETSSKEFKELQEQTAKYKKIIIETDRAVDALTEQGRGIGTALSLAEGTVAGFQAYTGVTALLGSENEELLETITKLQAAQGVLNSITVIRNTLDKNGVLVGQIRNVQQKILNKETKTQIALGKVQNIVSGKGNIIQKAGTILKLGGATAMKALNAVVKANPIMLLVGALTAVVGALAWFISSSDGATEANERANDAMNREIEILGKVQSANKKRGDQKLDYLKAIGASEEEKKNQFLKNLDEEEKARQVEFGRLNASYSAKNKLVESYAKEGEKEKVEQAVKDRDAITERQAEIKSLTIDHNNQILEVNRVYNESLQAAEKTKQAKYKTLRDKRLADAKKEQDELNKILMDQFAVEDEIFKMRLSVNDLQEQAVSDKYDALFLKAQGNAELEKQLIIQQEAELTTLRKGFADKTALDQATAIETANALRHSLMRESITEDLVILEEKYQAEREALQINELISSEEKIMLMGEIKEREEMEEALIRKKWDDKEIADEKILQDKKKALRDANIQQAENGLNALSSLNSLVSDLQLKKAKGNSVEEEKIRKASFQRNKAMQLGMAVIDSYKAITASLTTSPLTILGVPNPGALGALITTASMSAINIAKIASTQYGGGGGGGGASSSVPNLSSGGGTGASASSFAISDDTSSVQTELNADGSQAGANGQTQVVVVETDITTAVNNVAQINEVSTF